MALPGQPSAIPEFPLPIYVAGHLPRTAKRPSSVPFAIAAFEVGPASDNGDDAGNGQYFDNH